MLLSLPPPPKSLLSSEWGLEGVDLFATACWMISSDGVIQFPELSSGGRRETGELRVGAEKQGLGDNSRLLPLNPRTLPAPLSPDVTTWRSRGRAALQLCASSDGFGKRSSAGSTKFDLQPGLCGLVQLGERAERKKRDWRMRRGGLISFKCRDL